MEKIIKNQEKLFYLLTLLIAGVFLLTIYSGRGHISQKFDYKIWENKYDKSQWVVPQSKNEISDEDLYIFVGAKLVNGYDPSLVNAEMPPLGKYLIGISDSVFGYIGVYGIVMSLAALILFFILNKLLFKSNLVAVIPVFLLAIDPQFREQIGVSLLDIQYLSLLLLTFILFLKKKYLWAGISAGLFMATKSPFMVVVLYATFFGYFIVRKDFKFRNWVSMPIATFVAYTLVSIKMFFLGHSLRYFLSVQHYMINFYQTGATGIRGAVFPLLLTGYWFTLFNRNGFISDWSPVWPVALILTLLAFCKIARSRKVEDGFLLIGIWVILYMIFLIFTPVFPRYLLLAVPFMYNLSVWVLLKTIKSSHLHLSS